MQLIETETPSINISEKMSTIDEETVNEKPLANGDIKEIVEDVNGKLEANGPRNSENVKNKENILNNGDEVDTSKETEDVISAVKPLNEPSFSFVSKSEEIGDVILSADKPLDDSLKIKEAKVVEIKEAEDIFRVENLKNRCSPLEETKETRDVIPGENSSEKCSPSKEVNQAMDDLSAKQPMEENSLVQEINEEKKKAADVISVEKPLEDSSLTRETKEVDDAMSAKIPVEATLPIVESNVAEDTKEVDDAMSAKIPVEATLPIVESNVAEDTKEVDDAMSAKIPVEGTLPIVESYVAEDVIPAEKPVKITSLVEETEEVDYDISATKPIEDTLLVKETKEGGAGDFLCKGKPEVGCTLVDENVLTNQEQEQIVFGSAEQKEFGDKQSEEEERPQLEKESDVFGSAEQKEFGDKQSEEEEMPQLEKESELGEQPRSNGTENLVLDLEKTLETLPESVNLGKQCEKPKESQNNTAQNTEDGTEVDLIKYVQEKPESMDVDENDSNAFENELDMSEHDVTQSISDMVENIVQNLNDDAANDLVEDIEIDNNEIVKSIIPAEENSLQNIIEETANKPINKTEIGNTDGIEKDESGQNGNVVNRETSNLVKKEHTDMEIDEEPTENTVAVNPAQINDTMASENDQTTLIKDTPISNQKLSVVTEEDEASSKPLETVDIPPSESSNLDQSKTREVCQYSINHDMNQPDSSMSNIIEVSDDKAQNDTAVNALKEAEKIDMGTDNTEIIELRSGDSSANNSLTKTEDDIPSLATNNVKNDQDATNKEHCPGTPDEQIQMAGATVSETKGDESDTEKAQMIEDTKQISEQKDQNEKTPEKVPNKTHTPLIKLSNTMDILSDDEDEPSTEVTKDKSENKEAESHEKQCINLDDDDDIMLIDEDNKEDKQVKPQTETSIENPEESQSKIMDESSVSKDSEKEASEISGDSKKDSKKTEAEFKDDEEPQPDIDKHVETAPEKPEKPKPLIPPDFFKTYRKNLADMTRDDLEEFCILKIVESIIDRSNLNDIRSKLKTMALTIEEYKKKAMMLTKQNRDLQVVLKSVQEEQKKSTGKQPITPLKITRSVGMQVLMTDKSRRRVMPGPGTGPNTSNNANQVNNRNIRTPNQNPRNTPQKQVNNQPIPVPRLVPASNVAKTVQVPQLTNVTKATAVQNGVKNTSPAQKPEKRTHSRMQSQSSSVTVDLTDDEPPPKITPKSSPAPPVRLVNPQNLLAPRQQFAQQVNSPRKVFIPISINGPQAQQTRPGQTIMLKSVGQGPRPRAPNTAVVRAPQNMQVRKVVGSRHPAPLPDAMKQYQPPNWKALPPAPDLKLSKVENGIVISWKIEGYQEDSYEEIASYQLYAYQETSAPASTSLWKKIGDVKALPLPMACTLTQFMAGYKYYFAVRAVDIRSRLGPFSLPGSILLLNKM